MLTISSVVCCIRWLDKIFDEGKVWEIRSSNTYKRGEIQLIQSGSGQIIGKCVLQDSIALTKQLLQDNVDKHKVEDLSIVGYKTPHAWVLADAQRYETPIPYKHPAGAVIWVKLPSKEIH